MNRWIGTWRRWIWINPILIALNGFDVLYGTNPFTFLNLGVVIMLSFMTGSWFADLEYGRA